MIKILFFMVVVSSNVFSVKAFAKNDVCPSRTQMQKMAEPPFYLSDFDEFVKLSRAQKKLYLKSLGSLTSANSLIPNSNKLETESFDECQWENLRLSIFETCSKNKEKKLCDQLKEIRLNSLRLGETRPQ
ncbi:MAG: hypothetical protein ACXVCL_19225 [Bdellovibrio sp.]